MGMFLLGEDLGKYVLEVEGKRGKSGRIWLKMRVREV